MREAVQHTLPPNYLDAWSNLSNDRYAKDNNAKSPILIWKDSHTVTIALAPLLLTANQNAERSEARVACACVDCLGLQSLFLFLLISPLREQLKEN